MEGSPWLWHATQWSGSPMSGRFEYISRPRVDRGACGILQHTVDGMASGSAGQHSEGSAAKGVVEIEVHGHAHAAKLELEATAGARTSTSQPKADRTCPEINRYPRVSNSPQVRPNPPQSWSNFLHVWSNMPRVWPNPFRSWSNLSQSSPNLSQIRSNPPECSPIPFQNWSSLPKIWPNMPRVLSNVSHNLSIPPQI